MRSFRYLAGAAFVVGAAVAYGSLHAAVAATQSELKIGLVLTVSGPFASSGKQIRRGIDLYMAEHGDTVAGRKISLVVKDTAGMAPAVAKRQAQELVVKDGAAILAGFALTPNAFSVASLATEAKVPMVVMNAATSSVTEKSPYIVRTSMTLPQVTAPMAQWAYDNGVRSAYILATDYGPGHDAQGAFDKAFTALGGKIVGSVRTPVNTPDYSPFLLRMLDTKPDAVFTFVPNGHDGVALGKGLKDQGVEAAGIRVLSTGDLTNEDVLPALGDAALGFITSFHYSVAHPSPENQAFVKAYKAAYSNEEPTYMTVAAYDGMRLIYQALEKTGGSTDAQAFVDAAKGMHWESPRGPITIDPATRDTIQNVYIREVKHTPEGLQNVEFYTFKAVKDPVKAAEAAAKAK